MKPVLLRRPGLKPPGIVARAKIEADLEKKKVADEVKNEMVSLASVLAGKVIGNTIDAAAQDSLIDETLKEIGDSTWLSLVSETYGEALFSLGMEKEIVDSLMDEIDSLWKILKENPGFSSLMNHPDIGKG